jgi:hypothetical protein
LLLINNGVVVVLREDAIIAFNNRGRIREAPLCNSSQLREASRFISRALSPRIGDMTDELLPLSAP